MKHEVTIPTPNKRSLKSIWTSALVMAGICMASVQDTFAASVFFSKAQDAAKTVYNDLYGIIVPVFGLAALICLIVIAVSPGRSFEKAISWLIRLVIAFLVINCLGWAVAFLQGLTTGGSLYGN